MTPQAHHNICQYLEQCGYVVSTFYTSFCKYHQVDFLLSEKVDMVAYQAYKKIISRASLFSE